jgi:hypothetical protein
MHAIPHQLCSRPFLYADAIDAGVTPAMLRTQRFRKIHRGVYVLADVELDLAGRIAAARLALPPDARLSHISRIQELGLRIGPEAPLHFTVARDHHVVPRGVMLHRTKVIPPADDYCVSPAAAFIAICESMMLVDLITIGDWLLHGGHMSLLELRELARRDRWRPGAAQAHRVSRFLDPASASPQESRMRCYVVFAQLPVPTVNARILDDPNSPIADLWLEEFQLALEFEGGHHFADKSQVKRDIWRYAAMRDADIAYIQVTHEMLRQPKAFAMTVDKVLRSRGYIGPKPIFGELWNSLFRPVPRVGYRGFEGAETATIHRPRWREAQ